MLSISLRARGDEALRSVPTSFVDIVVLCALGIIFDLF